MGIGKKNINVKMLILIPLLLGLCLIIASCGSTGPAGGTSSPNDLFFSNLNQQISQNGAEWTASQNAVSNSSSREKFLGLTNTPRELKKSKLIKSQKLASNFSWQNYQGKNWLSPVKNQNPYPTCLAFALIGTLEARIRINNNNPNKTYDLSEWYAFHKGKGDLVNGWNYDDAFDFLQNSGTVLEIFALYQNAPDFYPENSNKANNYKILNNTWLPSDINTIKSAIMDGPVLAAMEVFSDFYYYSSGVYTYMAGKSEGYHAIMIVGWDDAQQCWICKNSWGEDWGESGYFRIRYGQCQINDYVVELGNLSTPIPLICYASDRDGNFEIYTMNQDGTNQRRVTNSSSKDLRPCFSPDYSKIVYTSAETSTSEIDDICMINVDGSGFINLTNTPNVDEDAPNWSSDGSKVAFSKKTTNKHIYTMNYNGSNMQELTSLSVDYDYPYFSPDGQKIIFQSWRDGDNEIFSINADGSNEQQLTNNFASDVYPSMSRDGLKIAFISDRDGRKEVYTMNLDGTEQTRLTFSSYDNYGPHWSPDSQRIVYDSNNPDGTGDLCLINKIGGGQIKLTNNNSNEWYPNW